MKKLYIYKLSIFFCLLLVIASQAQALERHAGEHLLDIKFPLPSDKTHQSYLGVDKSENRFTVSQIKTEVLVIEIFSMYCPHCQKDAPRINDLFKKIQNSDAYKNRIKLIGIGAGNSNFEVNFFRKNYKIKFPLFADEDFSIHKKIGSVRTPYFIGLRFYPNGKNEIFLSESGDDKTPSVFFDLIIKKSGL